MSPQGLFEQQGPIAKLDLVYDRAGRSTGVAFVTYEDYEDAKKAIENYNGANAKGNSIPPCIVPTYLY